MYMTLYLTWYNPATLTYKLEHGCVVYLQTPSTSTSAAKLSSSSHNLSLSKSGKRKRKVWIENTKSTNVNLLCCTLNNLMRSCICLYSPYSSYHSFQLGSAVLRDLLSHDAVTPQEVREAVRRYSAETGPFADLSVRTKHYKSQQTTSACSCSCLVFVSMLLHVCLWQKTPLTRKPCLFATWARCASACLRAWRHAADVTQPSDDAGSETSESRSFSER